jgi:outer membrane protein assembly factor BamB
MPLVRLLLAALVVPLTALAAITPANVASLAQKWNVDVGTVTGGALERDGRLYVGSWGSHVLALDPRTGAEIWSRPVTGAVPGRVLLLDDGGVCYGTLSGEVGCLDGDTGAVRWQKSYADPLQGVVWSTPTASNGMLFVGIAGLADNPCSRGRLLALDLATGDEKWRLYTIPEKVCHTDTIEARRRAIVRSAARRDLGVALASPRRSSNPTGQWVYMNTVGCYTFPSIGDSDSMFKVAASNGMVEWKQRVSQPEQFGTCQNDTSIDCGLDADCGVGNTCTKKSAYHDFGFVNGPLRIDAPDGLGGTRTLIVSGSKNGTLYAFNEDGTEAWHNTPLPSRSPASPASASSTAPSTTPTVASSRRSTPRYRARVRNDPKKGCNEDGDCPGGTCPVEHKHLVAFDPIDGHILWEEEIGRSYSHVAVVNGIVWAGTNDTDKDGASWLYAHDAATGARLATFPLPKASSARVAVDENSVYVGYGVLSPGGSRLPAQRTIDPARRAIPAR